MAKFDVGTRLDEATHESLTQEAKRRGVTLSELLRERIEAGGSVQRMERIVEVLAKAVGDIKAGLNRVETAQTEAAAKVAGSFNALRVEQERQSQATAASLKELNATMATIASILKE